MPDIMIQAIEPCDLHDVADCWRAAAKQDPCDVALLSEKILDDHGVLPHLRLAARDKHRLAGICVGALRDTTDDRRGYVKLLAVHPDARRRGIGTALLKRVEYELLAAGATLIRIAESAPNYLTPGVDSQNQLLLRFLQHRGYVPVGEACNMRVDLRSTDLGTAMRAACETRQVGQTTVRRATEEDRLAVERFVLRHWAAWLPEVHQALRNAPISLHLAIRNEAAMAGGVMAFAAYDANNRGTGWFGPMGTDPTCRGRGLAASCC